MLAATHLLIGLGIAHLAWLWAFLFGSVLRRSAGPAQTREEALLDVVLTTACGFALTGFATFVLGLAGLLYPATGAAVVLAVVALLVVRGAEPTRAAFWRERLDVVRRAASGPALIVWMIAVFVAVPAIIPDSGSDATFYYLSLAFDWAHAHRLAVDYWLRLPYTTNNWPLILTWAYVYHVEEYASFLNWLMACLTLLATYGWSAWAGRLLRGNGGSAGVQIAAVLAAVSVATTPIFLQIIGITMIDVPSALFFTAAAISGVRAVVTRDARHVVPLVVCGAYLIGTKSSFVAFFPLFAALIALGLKAAGASRRAVVLGVAALALLSAPWFVNAFVGAGDPLAPVLNLQFHHADVKWSTADMKAQLQDLAADKSPQTLLRVPWLAFTRPDAPSLRGVGISVMGMGYPLAAFVVAFALFRKRRTYPVVVLTAAIVVYAVAYWDLTSYLLRYAVLFTPLVAALLAMLFVLLTRRSPLTRLAALPLMAVLAIPAPASAPFFDNVSITDYRLLGQLYAGRTDWLEQRAPAYSSIEYLCRTFGGIRQADDRVYVIYLSNSQLFFKECGLQMIGDAFGPERFSDLGRAISHERIPRWAKRLKVGAFMLPRNAEDFAMFAGLSDELKGLGWKEVLFPQSDWEVYLSPQTQRALDERRARR